MPSNIYYYSEKLFYGNLASSKARNDLELLFSKNSKLERLGPQMVAKVKRGPFYLLKAFIKSKLFCSKLKKIRNSKIIFQYPITRGKVINKYIKDICDKNEIIFFIHDVNYLRNEELNKEEEIEFLNCASIIVCHNEKMKEKLISDGLKVKKIIVLNIFDYLLDDIIDNYVFERSVVYAGNLDKGGFLGKLANTTFNYKLNLFGPNFNLDDNNSIKYFGSFSPDEVPYKLNASYGLIWDSLDIDTCTGKLGYYTQYNNPHKLSLYLCSGIPVIAWSKSAISDFIIKNKVGIVIDSLSQIDEALDKITEDDYKEMKNNVKIIQKKLYCGEYTQKVLNEIIGE